MENQETVETKKKRQVRVTFEGLSATVNVKDSDEVRVFDIEGLTDEIKLKLLQYGWKQKVSDFRASDKLQGDDKADAIADCHAMLELGEFTQKRETSKVSLADQRAKFAEASDADKEAIKRTFPELYDKLNK